MSARDPRFEAWLERARAISCREELERRGVWSRRMFGDAGVPCPGCGGTDRFAVNLKKNVWHCRASGTGGDAIALVQHVDGASFLTAVEILTGEPPPHLSSSESDEERAARIAFLEERSRQAATEARRQADASQKFRRWEQEAAYALWQEAVPIAGTPAADYLALRGLHAPAEAALRYHGALGYHADAREHRFAAREMFRGPAMVAAIQNAEGHFVGLHRTWLDLAEPDGKRVIVAPQTGEILPAKKVRGSKRGGTIRLAGHPSPSRAPRTARVVVMGEGIETTLSAFVAFGGCAARDQAWPDGVAGVEFCAGVDLGNIAGKAKGRVAHPSEMKLCADERWRRVFVPDGMPAPDDDTPMIGLPDTARELVLLGDGDSEPVRTELALQRAALRFVAAYPRLEHGVRIAMARAGLDFNEMLRVAA